MAALPPGMAPGFRIGQEQRPCWPRQYRIKSLPFREQPTPSQDEKDDYIYATEQLARNTPCLVVYTLDAALLSRLFRFFQRPSGTSFLQPIPHQDEGCPVERMSETRIADQFSLRQAQRLYFADARLPEGLVESAHEFGGGPVGYRP